MITLAQLLEQVPGLRREELDAWMANGWVLPVHQTGEPVFAEVDVARVRFICECRHDLGLDDETLPMVLSLVDQVYRLRRELRDLCEAVAAQPEEVRRHIGEMLERRRRWHSAP